MPSDDDILQDLKSHAAEAVALLQGVSPARLRADRMRRLALERLLEILGEAAGRLSEDARRAIPHDWRGIRGLRNVLAHQYGDVDPDRLHQVVQTQVKALLQAMAESKGAGPLDAWEDDA